MSFVSTLLKKRRTPLGIAVSFVLFLLCFHLLLRVIPFLYDYTILPFTQFVTEVSTLFLNIFGAEVIREGKRIVPPGLHWKIEINDGCNGLYASAILLAAFLCQPSTLKAKLIGLGIGLPLVFALNQLRIVTIYFVRLWYGREAMDFFHIYFWQTLMILSSLLIWLAWAHYFVPKARALKEKHAE